MLATLQKLVECESPTSDIESARAITALAQELSPQWLPGESRVEEHEGRPVWRWGASEPEILLLGHLDTVWPLGTLTTIPFAINGDRITGPGVFDMKAGIVQGWAAVQALPEQIQAKIGMLLTQVQRRRITPVQQFGQLLTQGSQFPGIHRHGRR